MSNCGAEEKLLREEYAQYELDSDRNPTEAGFRQWIDARHVSTAEHILDLLNRLLHINPSDPDAWVIYTEVANRITNVRAILAENFGNESLPVRILDGRS